MWCKLVKALDYWTQAKYAEKEKVEKHFVFILSDKALTKLVWVFTVGLPMPKAPNKYSYQNRKGNRSEIIKKGLTEGYSSRFDQGHKVGYNIIFYWINFYSRLHIKYAL